MAQIDCMRKLLVIFVLFLLLGCQKPIDSELAKAIAYDFSKTSLKPFVMQNGSVVSDFENINYKVIDSINQNGNWLVTVEIEGQYQNNSKTAKEEILVDSIKKKVILVNGKPLTQNN